MHLELAPPSTAPPRRLINASQANGLAWSVWRELDDFLFEVSPLKARADDPPTVALYASAADFSTAHKAEQAAKAWCAAYVPPAAPEPAADREDHEVILSFEEAEEVIDSMLGVLKAAEAATKRGWPRTLAVMETKAGSTALIEVGGGPSLTMREALSERLGRKAGAR